jgi:murein endopeptidase
VRAAYGEGTIIGAQCTPHELTQYRIEKKDGERFWAQASELTAL